MENIEGTGEPVVLDATDREARGQGAFGRRCSERGLVIFTWSDVTIEGENRGTHGSYPDSGQSTDESVA